MSINSFFFNLASGDVKAEILDELQEFITESLKIYIIIAENSFPTFNFLLENLALDETMPEVRLHFLDNSSLHFEQFFRGRHFEKLCYLQFKIEAEEDEEEEEEEYEDIILISQRGVNIVDYDLYEGFD